MRLWRLVMRAIRALKSVRRPSQRRVLDQSAESERQEWLGLLRRVCVPRLSLRFIG